MNDVGEQIPAQDAGFPFRALARWPFEPTPDGSGSCKVGEGWVRIGRKCYEVYESSVTITEGKTYYLQVKHPTSATADPQFSVVTGDERQNTADTTYIPLYEIRGGQIFKDFRICPTVPLYE